MVKDSREGKMQLGGHFEMDDAFVVKEVIATLSRKRRQTVTMQDALYEALSDWCAKQGVTLPSQKKGRESV